MGEASTEERVVKEHGRSLRVAFDVVLTCNRGQLYRAPSSKRSDKSPRANIMGSQESTEYATTEDRAVTSRFGVVEGNTGNAGTENHGQ